MILSSAGNLLSEKINVEKFGVPKPTHLLWVCRHRGQYLAVSLLCAVLYSEIRVL